MDFRGGRCGGGGSLDAHTDVQPATGGKRGASERERERDIYICICIRVYTRLRQATRYTRELMPLTHRSHLPGLSYGDIFDRAIIPNTIYTARATHALFAITVRDSAPDRRQHALRPCKEF